VNNPSEARSRGRELEANRMSSFTPSQTEAIRARGNVLVQAGAGAGKTRTLVARCIEWLLEPGAAHSLRDVLIVTFTEAAAAELRSRIRGELSRRSAEEPGNLRLAEQLFLIETAWISTLHSFCLQLVREHFFVLGLDPQVAVLPAEEGRLLGEETLTKILRRHYAGESRNAEAVQRLIQALGRGWEQRIRRLIFRIHDYRQTRADSERWVERQRSMFQSEEPGAWRLWVPVAIQSFCQTWRLPLAQIAADFSVAENGVQSLHRLASLVSGEASLPRNSTKELAAELTALRELGAVPGVKKNPVRARHPAFFDDLEFLLSLMEAETGEPDPLRQDWNWCRTEMLTLIELVEEFHEAFSATKRELGAVDFHDLEQLSLRLLRDDRLERPTPVAEQWRKRLQLLFIDEYQDINAAQDAILTALGGVGTDANRFLVGDVKQSIYRFRLADPAIFQRYATQWSEAPAGGSVLTLSENFRSHEGILEFVNAFFARAMTKEVGGIDYDEGAHLRFGDSNHRVAFSRNVAGEPPVELHLLLKGAGEDEITEPGPEGATTEERSATEKEARMVAARLLELKTGGQCVQDEASSPPRPVKWSDMVILLRSPRSSVEGYAREFARLGIPLTASRSGFLQGTEISDLMSGLRLLDNPLQDLPLLAVLRSPLVDLSADEIAVCRLARSGKLWSALKKFVRDHDPKAGTAAAKEPSTDDSETSAKYREGEPELKRIAASAQAKLGRFLRRFERWRRFARENPVSRCLERILSDTSYSLWLQFQGEQRQANVRKLLVWARQFDQAQRQGLSRFLNFVEAQESADLDPEPAALGLGDAVRLMSIHQSKGLEFPIVILAGLGKAFNLADLTESVILDEELGLCPQIIPPHGTHRYPSLPYWLARARQKRELLGEELRLLYVGMTRAAQRLILAGTASRNQAARKWTPPAGERFDAGEIVKARCALDWLGQFLANLLPAGWTEQRMGNHPLLTWAIHSESALDARSAALVALNNSSEPEAKLTDGLEFDRWRKASERAHWPYPFKSASEFPAKTSVSQLRRAMELDDDAAPLVRPRLLSHRNRSGLTPAEIGTAHHRFLQCCSLAFAGTVEGLVAEADRLRLAGTLSAEERNALDIAALAAFWSGSVGQLILASRTHTHRELPFTARFSLAELESAGLLDGLRSHVVRMGTEDGRDAPMGTGLGNEWIVVQGVADLVVLLPDEFWILDFKTDETTKAALSDKVSRYQVQLRLYAMALSRIYGRPVRHGWLHFIMVNQTVECLGAAEK
jgi:ATP-dependent helicase/nuclease subunit A